MLPIPYMNFPIEMTFRQITSVRAVPKAAHVRALGRFTDDQVAIRWVKYSHRIRTRSGFRDERPGS